MRTFEALVLIVLLSGLHLALTMDPESSSWGLWGVRVAIAWCLGQILIRQLLSVLYAWQDWRRYNPEPEPAEETDSWVHPLGQPKFHPAYGVYTEVFLGDRVHNVVLQPDYWRFLPALEMGQEEALVRSSPMSSVKPGEEPGSLVCIQDHTGRVVGMGARVNCGLSTVLVTSFHVLKCGEDSELYLAKYSASSGEGRRVLLERSWEVEYGCGHPLVDVATVKIPLPVWSKLGVKSSPVGAVKGNMPVQCYGATSSKSYRSSIGFVRYDKVVDATHTCSTEPGWSGTPLFYNGKVVGIHRKWDTIGKSNTATLFSVFHKQTESSECESDCLREIEYEEMLTRDETHDILVHGRGKYTLGFGEYSIYPNLEEQEAALRRGGKSWFDMVEEEDDFTWSRQMEAAIPLNCQQAVGRCSPPQETSAATLGATVPYSPQRACPSLSVEDRLVSLERLVENQLASSAKTQESISLLSATLAGLKEAGRQNLVASCSKPGSSAEPTPPPTSQMQSASLSESTQGSANVPASKATPGKRKKSKGKSKKSASGKCSGTQAPESPTNC